MRFPPAMAGLVCFPGLNRYGTTIDVGADGVPSDMRIDLTIPGVIDIHGNPVGTPTDVSPLQRAIDWVKSNPLLAAGIGVGAVYLVRRK